MTTPFQVFRDNSKILLVIFGVLLMISFVVLPPLLQFAAPPQVENAEENEVVVVVQGEELTKSRVYSLASKYQIVGAITGQAIQQAIALNGNPQAPWPPIPGLQVTPATAQGPASAQIYEVGPNDAVGFFALIKKADELGIVVDDQTVRDFMKNTTGGRLSDLEYNAVISEFPGTIGGVRITFDLYFEMLREVLKAQKVQALLVGRNTVVTPPAAWVAYRNLNRTLSAELFPIEASKFMSQVPEPNETQIREFFEKNRHDINDPTNNRIGFRQLDKVSLAYVKGDLNTFLEDAKSQITEEEIEKYYNDNKDSFRKQTVENNTSEPPAEDATASETPADTEAEKPEETEGAEKEPMPEPEPQSDEPESTSPAEDPQPEPETPAESEQPKDSPEPEEGSMAAPSGVRFVTFLQEEGEEPKEENPSKEEGKAEKPAEEEQPKQEDKPAKETEEEEAPPAEKKEEKPSQPEKPAEESAEEPEPKEEMKKPADPPSEESQADKPSEEPAPEAPTGDTPSVDDQPMPEEGKQSAGEGTPDAVAEASEPPVEYRTLEEVKEEIRDRLAQPIAQDKLTNALNEFRGALQEEFSEYRDMTDEERDGLNPYENLGLEALANDLQLTFGVMPLSDRIEASLLPLASEASVTRYSYDPVTQVRRETVSMVTLAFNSSQINYSPMEFPGASSPTVFQDKTEQQYLFWKTDQQDGYAPELNDVRDLVIKRWKAKEASKLAKEKAQRIADAVENVETFRAAAEENGKEIFVAENVTFYDQLSAMMPGQGLQLGTISGIENISYDTMNDLFGIAVRESGVIGNSDESIQYVTYVTQDAENAEALRQNFLTTIKGSQGLPPSIQGAAAQEFQDINQLILLEFLGSKAIQWKIDPDDLRS